MAATGIADRSVETKTLRFPLGESEPTQTSAILEGLGEFAERLSNRMALFGWADQQGVEHLAFRTFSMDERSHLASYLDPLCGGRSEAPLSLAPAEIGSGFDRWIPPQDWQQRDPQLAVFLNSCSGDIIAERRVESARRVRVPWLVGAEGEVHFYPVWDISLSEGESLYGPAPFRIHIASRFTEPQTSGAIKKMQAAVTRLLRGAPVGLEGIFDFLLEADVPYLVDAWAGELRGCRLPYCTPPVPSNGYSAEVCALIWALDLDTGIPQAGVLHSIHPLSSETAQVTLLACDPAYERERGADVQGVLGVVRGQALTRREVIQDLQCYLKSLKVRGGVGASHIALAQLLDHEFVREGWVHYRFLQEDWVPSRLKPTPEEWAWLPVVLKLDEQPGWRSGVLVYSGRRYLCSAFKDSEVAVLSEGARPAADRVSEGCWRVYFSTGPALVRFDLGGLHEDVSPHRALRALSSGRVMRVELAVSAWRNADVCWLECGGVWLPHVVPAKWAQIFHWQKDEGQYVRVGELLGVVPAS
jgi:hypothetical protein